MNGDPVASCWHLALSAVFPRGEAFFIAAVREHGEGADAALAADIRDFVQQEVHHSREHLGFNRWAAATGYDLSRIDARLVTFLARIEHRPRILNLAATMALEHFTAMFAHQILSDPSHFAATDAALADLWRWHAVEELEHKGVAHDTWRHATRDWTRTRRWRVRALMMLVVTRNFVAHRMTDTLDLLAQDGITGWRARLAVHAYLFGRRGILRRIFPAWCAYFRPGFHPWDRDDRHLIAANMPMSGG